MHVKPLLLYPQVIQEWITSIEAKKDNIEEPSKRPKPLFTDPEGEALMANLRKLFLARGIKDMTSQEVFSPQPSREKMSMEEMFGSGVILDKVRGKIQRSFSNDEIRAGISRAVSSKALRRDLYTVLPKAKGKLPERFPNRADLGALRDGAEKVLGYLVASKKVRKKSPRPLTNFP